jgi:enamine deaminase RidA (YjgF/YER057c/UK114 family)
VSRVADRLAELGLALPPVAAPVAAYVPAVVDEGELAGGPDQGTVDDGGHIGGDGEGLVPAQDAAQLARLCALNALAAIGSVADLDDVRRVVKVVGFVASAPGFTGQPSVVNGASELLGQVFADAGRHARSAVGVAALPLGAPVEVEVVAALG